MCWIPVVDSGLLAILSDRRASKNRCDMRSVAMEALSGLGRTKAGRKSSKRSKTKQFRHSDPGRAVMLHLGLAPKAQRTSANCTAVLAFDLGISC